MYDANIERTLDDLASGSVWDCCDYSITGIDGAFLFSHHAPAPAFTITISRDLARQYIARDWC